MPKIEIFTGPNCGYCEAAKGLMRENGLAFDEIDLAASPDNMEDFRIRLPRVKAIPQIFVDGEHIGGLEDLRLHLADGRLGG
jgi:glutaredoxin 3